jgi:hypothetical protein
MSTWQNRDKMVREQWRDLRNDYPPRIRIARHLGSALRWAAFHLPNHLRLKWWSDGWSDGPLILASRATICRALGHCWDLVIPGAPRRGIGHMMMCETCSLWVHTDDLDAFHPGSRERRDLAAVGFELNDAAETAWCCYPTDRASA